jgi:tetratricopeptide (TPR) repeat protein
MRAHALVNLGVAERELHDMDAAIGHLQEGTALERQLNEAVALGEDLCELIIALLRQNVIEQATALAAEVLALAEDSTLRFPHPQYLLWTAAAVRRAAGDDAGALALLGRARDILDKLEATIPDTESRMTFRRLRNNRAIDDAFDRAYWQI